MALNIGQINFGVNANTTGLDKAITRLKQLEKITDQTARKQGKAAKTATAAMSKQEVAIRKAIEQQKAFLASLARLNLTEQQRAAAVFNSSRALGVLSSRLNKGALQTKDFNRATQDFTKSMNTTKRALTSVDKAAGNNKGLKDWKVLIRDLESSAILALGPLSGLGARIRSVSAIFGRSSIAMALWVTGIAAAVIGIGLLARAMISAGEEFKGLQLRFEAATGSMAKGNVEIMFTIGLANKLGLSYSVLTKSYSRFLAASQGTNLEGKKSRKIFEQIARAAAGLKLSGADLEGVMRAIEQIMSKGTVQAEELRGQLGDRFPGAFRIAAIAIGKTTQELNKMLKAGEIISEDFLPAFAAAADKSLGKNAEKNAKTLSGRFAQLWNNTKLVAKNMDDLIHASAAAASVIGVLGNVAGGAAGMIGMNAEEMAKAAEAAIDLAEATEKATKPAIRFGKTYQKISKDLDTATMEIKVMDSAIEALGTGSDDIEFLLNFFKAMPKAAALGADGMADLTKRSAEWLGLDMQQDAVGAAFALASLTLRFEALAEKITFLRNAPQSLKDVTATLTDMALKLKALQGGQESVDLFDDITTGSMAFKKELDKTNDSIEVRAAKLRQWITLQTEIVRLEKELAAISKDSGKADKDKARAIETQRKAMVRAVNTIELMRQKTAALAKGPESLEIFTKVEAPILRMEAALRKAGFAAEAIAAITGLYRIELEANLALTDKWARAHQQMADAIVNGLEDIITKGKSVREMLHGLATELIRIALRALFLDKLRSTLFSIFSGGAGPSMIPLPGGSSGGSSGGHPGGTGGGNFHSGGSFKLTGGDNVPFMGVGKGGETVSISRGDQMMGKGGITITQINNFEGGAMDPSILIPILEDNSRKIKAEILDGLDRGAFR